MSSLPYEVTKLHVCCCIMICSGPSLDGNECPHSVNFAEALKRFARVTKSSHDHIEWASI